MGDKIVTNDLESKVPWVLGSETGNVDIQMKITGPESVVVAISKELSAVLKQSYGSKSTISRSHSCGGTEQ